MCIRDRCISDATIHFIFQIPHFVTSKREPDMFCTIPPFPRPDTVCAALVSRSALEQPGRIQTDIAGFFHSGFPEIALFQRNPDPVSYTHLLFTVKAIIPLRIREHLIITVREPALYAVPHIFDTVHLCLYRQGEQERSPNQHLCIVRAVL